jgi:hypothetical protein
MQSRQKFTIFFFLQPCGYLSPSPCSKVATFDGSKLNHLHLSCSSYGIFRIPFITSMYSEMGFLRQRAEKWGEMNLHLRPGPKRYSKFEKTRWSARNLVHPNTLGIVTLAWDYAVSIGDTLSRLINLLNCLHLVTTLEVVLARLQIHLWMKTDYSLKTNYSLKIDYLLVKRWS